MGPSMDKRFASRKFLLTAAAYLTAVPLVVYGVLTPDQWVSFVTWLFGLYFAANVGQKATAKD